MKKMVCLLLACMMTLCSASALAAGKLSVTQENFHYVENYWNYGYAYAKVENVGDKPIKVNAGVLEIYDADGEVITSTDYVMGKECPRYFVENEDAWEQFKQDVGAEMKA